MFFKKVASGGRPLRLGERVSSEPVQRDPTRAGSFRCLRTAERETLGLYRTVSEHTRGAAQVSQRANAIRAAITI